MIFSAEKLEDIKWRAYYLREMESALRENLPVTAKACGEASRLFGEMIKNKNYSKPYGPR